MLVAAVFEHLEHVTEQEMAGEHTIQIRVQASVFPKHLSFDLKPRKAVAFRKGRLPEVLRFIAGIAAEHPAEIEALLTEFAPSDE